MTSKLDEFRTWFNKPQSEMLQAQLEARDARIARLERDALELEKRVFRTEMRLIALIPLIPATEKQPLDNERKG